MDPVEPPTVVAGYRREALPDPEAVGEDADAGRTRSGRRSRGTDPSPSPGSWSSPSTSPATATTGGRQPGPGTAGADFLTAPEAHPIFGAAIGRLLEQAWDALGRPSPFTVTEPGAGTGALAAGLLGGLRDLGLAAARRRSGTARSRWSLRASTTLRERLAADGLAGLLSERRHARIVEIGAVVANEVLDALPVHRVVGRDGGLRELLVDAGRRRATSPGSRPNRRTPALAERLAAEGVTLGDGQVTEICLALDAWLDGRHAPPGPRPAWSSWTTPPSPRTSTAPRTPTAPSGRSPATRLARTRSATSAARTSPPPWTWPRSGRPPTRAGLVPIGETTQAELLARVGTADLTDAYLRRPGATLQDALALRSALARLMDTRGMGGFRVLVFGRGLPDGLSLPALERVARPGA